MSFFKAYIVKSNQIASSPHRAGNSLTPTGVQVP